MPETREYELLPGIKSEPFFKTEEDYQRFRESFAAQMKPALDEQRRLRILSERDAMFHWVD